MSPECSQNGFMESTGYCQTPQVCFCQNSAELSTQHEKTLQWAKICHLPQQFFSVSYYLGLKQQQKKNKKIKMYLKLKSNHNNLATFSIVGGNIFCIYLCKKLFFHIFSFLVGFHGHLCHLTLENISVFTGNLQG